jgi:hypothetical protein
MHSSLVPLHLRAPGEVVFPMSIPQYLIYGEYIARFHIESSDFECGCRRFHYGTEVLIERPLRILVDFLGRDDQGIRFLN